MYSLGFKNTRNKHCASTVMYAVFSKEHWANETEIVKNKKAELDIFFSGGSFFPPGLFSFSLCVSLRFPFFHAYFA